MGQLGFGVMIGTLGGNAETVDAYNACIGKEIAGIDVKDEHLLISFVDKSVLDAWDDGQSCCESRHMSTDDDLSYYVGATLQSLNVKDGPSISEEYGDEHETEFLEVTTSKGSFTVVNHNEHNGYYGGFYVKLAVR